MNNIHSFQIKASVMQALLFFIFVSILLLKLIMLKEGAVMAKYILDQVAESAAGLFIPDNPEDQIGHGNEHIVGAA
ncbi:MAG: hypothetical protein ACOX74_04940 [Lachnospiraceae bacterium]